MKARKLELKDLGNGWEYSKIIALIAGCPEASPDGRPMALNYAEVVRRGDLVDEVEKADGMFLMEQSRYDLLLKLARAFNWAMFTPSGILAKSALDNIRGFMTELENAEVAEVIDVAN